MARSLDTCMSVFDRARDLVKVYDGMEEDEKNKDLLRSSVVLAVSGFDRYFTHRFTDILSSHLKRKNPSKDLIEVLERAGVNLAFVLKLVAQQKARPFRTIRNKVQPSLFRLTTQQTSEIDKLFNKVGIHGLTGRVQSQCGKKLLIKRINHAVLRRHKIAHEGDLNSHYKPNDLSPNTVNKWIDALEEYVVIADGIVGEHE